MRQSIFGIKTKIPNLGKIVLGYIQKAGKYTGKKLLTGSKYLSNKTLDNAKKLAKKYRRYKLGPKIYKEGQKPLKLVDINDV